MNASRGAGDHLKESRAHSLIVHPAVSPVLSSCPDGPDVALRPRLGRRAGRRGPPPDARVQGDATGARRPDGRPEGRGDRRDAGPRPRPRAQGLRGARPQRGAARGERRGHLSVCDCGRFRRVLGRGRGGAAARHRVLLAGPGRRRPRAVRPPAPLRAPPRPGARGDAPRHLHGQRRVHADLRRLLHAPARLRRDPGAPGDDRGPGADLGRPRAGRRALVRADRPPAHPVRPLHVLLEARPSAAADDDDPEQVPSGPAGLRGLLRVGGGTRRGAGGGRRRSGSRFPGDRAGGGGLGGPPSVGRVGRRPCPLFLRAGGAGAGAGAGGRGRSGGGGASRTPSCRSCASSRSSLRPTRTTSRSWRPAS